MGRTITNSLVFGLVSGAGALMFAAAPPAVDSSRHPVVTVRVYKYAGLSSKTLEEARRREEQQEQIVAATRLLLSQLAGSE